MLIFEAMFPEHKNLLFRMDILKNILALNSMIPQPRGNPVFNLGTTNYLNY